METMDIEEIIEWLAHEYDMKPSTIKNYYELLKKYSCFDDTNAAECLELVCQDRLSAAIDYEIQLDERRTNEALKDEKIVVNTVNQSIQLALKTVYPDYFESLEEKKGTSIVYDDLEFDLMEREDRLEEIAEDYWFELDDMRTKDREAYARYLALNKKNTK